MVEKIEKRNGFGIGHGIKSMGIVSGLDMVVRENERRFGLNHWKDNDAFC